MKNNFAGSCDLADDIGSAGSKSGLEFEDFSGRQARFLESDHIFAQQILDPLVDIVV